MCPFVAHVYYCRLSDWLAWNHNNNWHNNCCCVYCTNLLQPNSTQFRVPFKLHILYHVIFFIRTCTNSFEDVSSGRIYLVNALFVAHDSSINEKKIMKKPIESKHVLFVKKKIQFCVYILKSKHNVCERDVLHFISYYILWSLIYMVYKFKCTADNVSMNDRSNRTCVDHEML